jgi:Do/DeqQ family serine protease
MELQDYTATFQYMKDTKKSMEVIRMRIKKGFKTRKLLGVSIVLAVLIAGALSVSIVTASGTSGVAEETKHVERTTKPTTVNAGMLESLQQAYREVAAKVLPVVVQIDVVDVVTQSVPQYRSPFDFFFGPQNEDTKPREQQFKRYGLGSGVIVRRANDKVYVLTNNHVVGEADEISVMLNDESRYTAKLVGRDPKKDLALVVFETKENVPVAEFGDSDTVQVGDIVFAVGNPMGFSSTVTSGIVSAIGRKPLPESGVAIFTDYIQTDTAINQGNSGGPLVDIYGRVIGINTWISSPSGGSVGLGFTIPINNAKQAIEDFITKGKVEYGWLGVNIIDLADSAKKDLGIGDLNGSFVHNVYKGSPAYKAGIRPGDYIVSVDGKPIQDTTHFLFAVGNLKPGERYDFELVRDGKKVKLSVRITERGEDQDLAQQAKNLWPGMFVLRITEDIEKQLDLPKKKGELVVARVDNDTPAAVAGIRPGDIVMEINGQKVTNLRGFYTALNEHSGKTVLFRIFRQGQELTVGIDR